LATGGSSGPSKGGAAAGGTAADGGSSAVNSSSTQGGSAQAGRGQGGRAVGSRAVGGTTAQAGWGQGGVTAGGGAQGGSSSVASGSTGTTSNVASQYVDAINAVRQAVTAPTNYSGTWAPLPNVTWSDTVAASAQTWANTLASTQNCGLTHESNTGYGENLAAGMNLTPSAAVKLWADEKSKYTYSAKYTQADFNGGSGHYTQLVWRKSTEVGCGSATCGGTVVISCRFNPPGNYLGEPVY
jgi:uncharacterized protein YkwD